MISDELAVDTTSNTNINQSGAVIYIGFIQQLQQISAHVLDYAQAVSINTYHITGIFQYGSTLV
jgi:hypothetical protein